MDTTHGGMSSERRRFEGVDILPLWSGKRRVEYTDDKCFLPSTYVRRILPFTVCLQRGDIGQHYPVSTPTQEHTSVTSKITHKGK